MIKRFLCKLFGHHFEIPLFTGAKHIICLRCGYCKECGHIVTDQKSLNSLIERIEDEKDMYK